MVGLDGHWFAVGLVRRKEPGRPFKLVEWSYTIAKHDRVNLVEWSKWWSGVSGVELHFWGCSCPKYALNNCFLRKTVGEIPIVLHFSYDKGVSMPLIIVVVQLALFTTKKVEAFEALTWVSVP